MRLRGHPRSHPQTHPSPLGGNGNPQKNRNPAKPQNTAQFLRFSPIFPEIRNYLPEFCAFRAKTRKTADSGRKSAVL
jgi:hypothetical protein